MRVRPKKSAPAESMPEAQAFSFPAPIRGLILNENIAMASQGGAAVLDNWICTTTGIRARAGTSPHIPLGGKVRSMFAYRSGGVEAAFAARTAAIYPITASSLTEPTAAVTGQTSGYYSTEQFGTAGGDFLYAVNGSDKARLFNGTTWTQIDGTSTPAITGADTENFSHVWSFASRLFFVKKNSTMCYYLPVDSIAGAVSEFSLAGIFKRGGNLLYGATWSLDAGDGLDDKCVFVSDQGEVAIYEGTNPGDAAAWSKAGVYSITPPLGRKAKMQAGGDLLIATQTGLVPISQAISRDIAALEMSSVSKNITPLWQSQAFALSAVGWEIEKWPTENVMVITQPSDSEDTCLVANLQTGAWSKFTGLNVQCLVQFDNSLFFGGADGTVYRFESSGSDSGTAYTAAYLGKSEELGVSGMQKTVAQVRAKFRGKTKVKPLVTAKTDYNENLSSPPNASTEVGAGAIWGASKWGEATWGGATVSTQAVWSAVGRTGFAVAPEVQVTFGGVAKPDVELVAIDATFHVGALVT